MTTKTPRSFTSGREGEPIQFSKIALQRTCKLVDEWSARFGATVETRLDIATEDERGVAKLTHDSINGWQYTIERRYRVASLTPEARAEQEAICNFVMRFNLGNGTHVRWMQKLIDAEYSQSAINEVLNG